MTFKANWEKTHIKHRLTDSLIKQMIKTVYPHNNIKNFNIIDDGCANINIQFSLDYVAEPIILRIYLR